MYLALFINMYVLTTSPSLQVEHGRDSLLENERHQTNMLISFNEFTLS